MTKLSTQRKQIVAGIVTLAITPFLAYFGSKLLISATCNSQAVWSFCELGEIPITIIISFGLLFLAAIFFTIATFRKSK